MVVPCANRPCTGAAPVLSTSVHCWPAAGAKPGASSSASVAPPRSIGPAAASRLLSALSSPKRSVAPACAVMPPSATVSVPLALLRVPGISVPPACTVIGVANLPFASPTVASPASVPPLSTVMPPSMPLAVSARATNRPEFSTSVAPVTRALPVKMWPATALSASGFSRVTPARCSSSP